jgi:flagellar capping protein FliD
MGLMLLALGVESRADTPATPTPPPTTASTSASASGINQTESTKVLGQNLSATVQEAAPSGAQQLTSSIIVSALGTSMNALQTVVNAPTTANGTGTTEYYSFGKRIFSQNFYFQSNGILQASVGISPVEVDVPIIAYPVGPLVLAIDGGVRFQADASGQLLPTIMADLLNDSTLEVKLSANATGTGFVNGDATLVAIRAGVGGNVDLVDGNFNTDAMFRFDGSDPQVQYGAMLKFLDGEIVAFVDILDPLVMGWSRLWQQPLFNWNGYCYAAGSDTCTAS